MYVWETGAGVSGCMYMGDMCMNAHNPFEIMYHPSEFRTR